MKRMTRKQANDTYQVDASLVERTSESAFGGEAIERLAAMENALEGVEQQYEAAVKKLEALKTNGKIRSATAQQLLAQKLTYSTLLALMGMKE